MGEQQIPGKDGERFLARKENIRKRMLKYTRKAFRMLPRMDKPRILDIGCGSGIPTLELARLSGGEVTGIDIDRSALDSFATRIKEAGLSNRVHVVYRSMLDIDFPEESFDIIWSEGSVYAVGFEQGLRDWKRFLKPGGFMMIHDEQGNVQEKLQYISNCGYELAGYFLLNLETWHTEYFTPLEKLVDEFKTTHFATPKLLEEYKQAQWELDMFRKSPERNSSVCFVMKKISDTGTGSVP